MLDQICARTNAAAVDRRKPQAWPSVAAMRATARDQTRAGQHSSNNQDHWFGPILSVDVVSMPPIVAR